MKKITPADVLASLERMEPVTRIDPAVAEAARASVARMASIG